MIALLGVAFGDIRVERRNKASNNFTAKDTSGAETISMSSSRIGSIICVSNNDGELLIAIYAITPTNMGSATIWIKPWVSTSMLGIVLLVQTKISYFTSRWRLLR